MIHTEDITKTHELDALENRETNTGTLTNYMGARQKTTIPFNRIILIIFKGDIDTADQGQMEQDYTCMEKLKLFMAKGCCCGICFCFKKKVRIPIIYKIYENRFVFYKKIQYCQFLKNINIFTIILLNQRIVKKIYPKIIF